MADNDRSVRKKLLSAVLFCILVLLLVLRLTTICLPKDTNRYFMLREYLKDHPEEEQYDVKVFGSCHSYTSFDPVYLSEHYGVDSFVYGNPSEILPTTYLRMEEQFKAHVPEVALVETWGIHPYETYIETSSIFGGYLRNNLETVKPLTDPVELLRIAYRSSGAKGVVKLIFPILIYRNRLTDGSVTSVDFEYRFEDTEENSKPWLFLEMRNRFANHGYKRNGCSDQPDYPELQAHVSAEETKAISGDIEEYVYKIIDLCRENGVTLIFYRAPYVSCPNELMRNNRLRQICEENGVTYVDLEQELELDYATDFFDHEHMSENGAAKATELLARYVVPCVNGAE